MIFYVKRRDILSLIYEIRGVTSKRYSKIDIAPTAVFGLRMRQARERLGVPQDKLGVMIGIDEHSASARMSRYENGVHEPPIATARLLANALRVPLGYLYCDDDVLAAILLAASELPSEDRRTLVASVQARVQEIKAFQLNA